MTTNAHQPGRVAVLQPTSRLDLAGAARLTEAVRTLEPKPAALVLNLKAVRRIDSVGLSAILEIAHGCRVVITEIHPHVDPIIFVALLTHVTWAPSETAGIEAAGQELGRANEQTGRRAA